MRTIAAVDRAVKAREARARLPRKGLSSWALGRHHAAALWGLITVVLLLAYQWPVRIGIAAGLGLVLVYVQALRSTRQSRRALELSEQGRLDEAADIVEDALALRGTLPVTRAILGVSLAACYLRLGENDLAIVLLSEVETSGALPEAHRPTLRRYQALTLIARGDLPKARALVNGEDPGGVWVVIAALSDQPEEAARALELIRKNPSGLAPHLVLPRRRIGALFVAYAFHRRAQQNPSDPRSADLRDRSLADAAGLERHWYAYFVHAWPELVAFADERLRPPRA